MLKHARSCIHRSLSTSAVTLESASPSTSKSRFNFGDIAQPGSSNAHRNADKSGLSRRTWDRDTLQHKKQTRDDRQRFSNTHRRNEEGLSNFLRSSLQDGNSSKRQPVNTERLHRDRNRSPSLGHYNERRPGHQPGPSRFPHNNNSAGSSFLGKGKAPADEPPVASLEAGELADIDPESASRSRAGPRRREKPKSDKDFYAERKAAREQAQKSPANAQASSSRTPRKAKVKDVDIKIAIPSVIALSNLAKLFNVKQRRLQYLMESIGMTDTRPDRVITSEDASLIALELGYDPIIDNEQAFDIYPDAPTTDKSTLPPRPPIVTIMGHVDHGKTTLLDTLRSTTVAAGEAGGITQHIGAFEVSLDSLLKGNHATTSSSSSKTITFLDTPGHAAFKAMRSRGRGVTDVVVLVVAADDGVMSQTKEVIDLIADGQGGVDPSVGVVVAITKCDKPGADPRKAKESLASAGITVEEFGGDVPCVEVSAVSGQGLPDLLETINLLAELRDLRTEKEGVRMEGRVIESSVQKGRGNVATVLVLRGTLKKAVDIVAGTTRCRVRQMITSSGSASSAIYPGQPVEITGWKELPQAGDEVLEAKDEQEAKKAVDARVTRLETVAMMQDVEAINEKRRLEAELEAARKAAEEDGQTQTAAVPQQANAIKELRLLIKADVSGSAEAVVGCLEGIGNKEAKVKIISSSVGDVSEADLSMAKTAEATIVGFNVNVPKSLQQEALNQNIPVLTSGIIYRLIEDVTAKVIALLPVIKQTRVVAEANILQVFHITLKGRQIKPIAGCRVANGTITKGSKVRVLRNQQTVYTGALETLRQGKIEASSVNKGSECGVSFEGFDDFQEGDSIQTFEEYEVKRSL